MEYMLLIYSKEAVNRTLGPAELMEIGAAHWKVVDEAAQRGILRAAAPLFPASTAKSVRANGGGAMTSDGPFAETKEQLGGYYIIDCKDENEAVEWARKLPLQHGAYQGCVEVRRVAPMPPRPGGG